jgi:membrane protease YdiL (CAAX protease family)
MTGLIRIKSPLAQLGVFLAVFSPQLLLLIYSLFAVPPQQPDMSSPDTVRILKWAQAFSSLAFFLLPAFLYAVFTFRGHYAYFLGFKRAERVNMYFLGIFCMLAAFPMVFWLGELNQLIPLPEALVRMEKETGEHLEDFLKVNHPSDIVVNVIVIALIPAFCEEMLFRGALQRILIQLTRNPWAGIIISAALFSALHLQFMGFLPRMFLGIVLGALYWYSGSLWTSILAHFVTNAVQVVVAAYATKMASENPTIPFYIAIASGIVVTGMIILLRKQSAVTWSKVYEREPA